MQNYFAHLGMRVPKISTCKSYLKYSLLLILFLVPQVQAVETIAPAPPNWGLDPITNTLLKPGVSIMTQGTLSAPGPGDGDHALKMYDTSSIAPLNSRPLIVPDIHTHSNWDVGSIGNVFGIAIDNDRNIYVTASTHFGATFGFAGDNSIINFGSIGAGVAADTFGTDNNLGDLNDINAAGTIYKLDKTTGNASIFAQLPQQAFAFNNVGCEPPAASVARNTGPALGNINYDSIHNQFFISNFEDGKIYRLDINGVVLSTYDPFLDDDGTVGLASDEKPYGLVVNLDASVLYFGTHKTDLAPRLFAVPLDPNGEFTGVINGAGSYSNAEINQNATLGSDLVYTQNVGGGFTNNPWVSYSDLKISPQGEMMIGLRTGCENNFASSHNHGGTYYLLVQDGSGLYNTPASQVPGIANPAANAYDAGSFPIFYKADVIGPGDGYGGIGIYDKGDGTYDYLITSADIEAEPGPHGFLLFPNNFTATGNNSTEFIINPGASFSAYPSSTSAGGDYKGSGGDIEVLSVLQDWGDAPDTYSTNLVVGDAIGGTDVRGPSHIITSDGIFLGLSVDAEFNGVPSIGADSDDNHQGPDDEDGISAFPTLMSSDTIYTIPIVNISAANSSGGPVTIHAWLDFDGNGVFDADEYTTTTVNNGLTVPNTSLNWSGVGVTGMTGGTTYARFRITNDPSITAATPGGYAANGEVEDYALTVIGNIDWGDAPDSGAGNGSGNYSTLSIDSGPSHLLNSQLFMGACIDDEADGQQSATANGDDNGVQSNVTLGTCVTANDDEDSLTPPTLTAFQASPTVTITTVNTTGSDATLACWVDYNGNGVFDNATERSSVIVANGDTSKIVTLASVPADAYTDTGGSTFMRCRIASNAAEVADATGVALSGEVEDYPITINPVKDWGDAPDAGVGNGTGDYSTLSVDNGPNHILNSKLFLGACVDDESDGQQTLLGNGDDLTAQTTGTNGTCATANDDEDGFTPPTLTSFQINPQVTVTTVNTTGSDATLACWVDYNGNGVFDNATERVSIIVANGDTSAVMTLPNVPGSAFADTGGSTFMRCRIASNAAEVADATGTATSGEVEGFAITINPVKDWGDAPDTGAGNGTGDYSTLNVDNGPNHILDASLFMGACVDDETDGQQSATANGDDTTAQNLGTNGTCATANDDEDSLTPPVLTVFQTNPQVTVTTVNTTGADATLACWVDYNGNGVFDNASERVAVIVANGDTSKVVTLPNVPGSSFADTGGSTFMRCRLASLATEVDNSTGAAANGEVEDYPVTISPVKDWGDAPDAGAGNGVDDYSTLSVDSGPNHILDASLFMGACVDDESDGQQTVSANGDDTGAANVTHGTCATANDDEDGLIPSSLQDGEIAPNLNVSVVNTTGVDATLACWIDYNGDGVFDNASERGVVTVASAATSATVIMPNVPVTAVADTGGTSFMRCRIATLPADVANSTGAAANGEIEDYPINFINYDFGDAPDSYGTLLASSGAQHTIVAGLQIGAAIDAEVDGQPNAAANGDGADEDGVTIPTLVDGDALTLNPVVTNLTGSVANLVCWIDYNGNGTFELGESGATTVPNGTNAAAIAVILPAVPSTASTDTSGSSFARCRLTTGALTGSTPTGLFADGEVEDYTVSIIPLQDWGDAPDAGAGNGAGDYSTLITDNGPHHILTASLFMGACVDDEANGQQNAAADGDDTGVASANTNGTCATANDDEDSLVAPLLSDGQVALTIDVAVHNTTGVDASLACWLDYNGDGVFDNVTERTATVVANGATTVTLILPDVPATASTDTSGTSYMRCRMATIATEIDNPTGAAASGEVEDYQITLIVATDWGDAPDTSVGNAAGDYSTLSNDNGPSHTLDANLFMGACVDDELDGQQNATATGDDNGTETTVTQGICTIANDDEDSITLPSLLDQQIAPTIDVAIINTTANPATVACWIDYNGDGVFDNASERGSNTINASGTVTITMPDVPATANADTGGNSYLRCRTASNAADVANSTGTAANGEVEDYPIIIIALNKLGDYVWYDNDQNGLQDAGEPGVNGITVELFTNATCAAPSSQTTLTANGGLPTADGWYEFTDLPAGNYCVQFSGLAPGWIITSQNQGGDDTVDSDVDSATGQIQNIVLTDDDPTNDMGIYAAIGNIPGQVYCDANLSLTYDVGEEQSGIAVTLLRDSDCDGTGDVTVTTIDTDGTGSFDFINLPVGLSPIPPNPAVCYVLNYDLVDTDLTGCSQPFLPVTSVVELSTDIPSAPPIEFGNHVGPPIMIPVNKWWALLILSLLIGFTVKWRFKIG